MIDRYTRPEMARLWAAEHRLALWLEIELLACEAGAREGLVPQQVPARLRERLRVDPSRMAELERLTRHDVAAFVDALAEQAGEDGRYLHLGLTSSDVLDTALAVQLRDAGGLILQGLDELLAVVRKRALEHRATLMIGRTHGVHAEPITLGLKLALWHDELRRGRGRLARAVEEVSYGKLSGAVGTYAHLGPAAEAYVCARLGVRPCPVSSQIVQRDRHAAYFGGLALVATSIEKFATEIRHLQRTEVGEAEEPFGEGQKGSSAMPHKRNPVLAENLCGLARLVRGYAQAALEDVPLWHERDISHSSVERVIAPDATALVDFMLHRFTELVAGLVVRPKRMLENLALTRGLYASQRVLLALVQKGLSRQEAYRLVQRNAMQAWDARVEFQEALEADPEVMRHFTSAELRACFDPSYYVRHADEVFRRVFGEEA
ncbi:MAG: adenylosuccinate lyase [Deltaproteobacteria bacterium]|nr:adenylosuccinate lyase [Deltaproteobacteria bacterium]